jgi:hypothetical protein
MCMLQPFVPQANSAAPKSRSPRYQLRNASFGSDCMSAHSLHHAATCERGCAIQTMKLNSMVAVAAG